MYNLSPKNIARGMLAIGSGRLAKKVKHQVCYIMCHPQGHPVQVRGQFLVYKSLWRAIAANIKSQHVIKKLDFEL